MDLSSFRTIDWIADGEAHNRTRLGRSHSKWTWEHIKSAAQSWIALALCGALIGAIAVILTLSTGWLADLREGHCTTSWYLNESTCCTGQLEDCTVWKEHPAWIAYFVYLLISVVFATATSFIVVELAPLAAGSGISEIKCIVSGYYAPQFLNWLVLVIKCITLPLTIASGLSVGKEGPSVHYAACVGHLISFNFLKQDYRKRSDLITACCAAGVAVAFGSPIGGLLFGMEEIATDISLATIWRTYFCCLVATSVVAIFNPFRTRQLVLFSVKYDASWHLFELPFFVLIGILGGLVGQFIIKYNLRITALRRKYWGKYYLHEALVLSLLTALICYWNQYLKVDMTKSMQILFHECEHGGESHMSCNGDKKAGIMVSLGLACAIRLALLLITYGAAKVPAGIFVPSLAIGALFGRFIGTSVWMLQSRNPDSFYFSFACPADSSAPCINPGAYAVLGAGALLAGVMHITLTVVVVMFEVTGAIHYIVPTMIVVGVTRLISSLVGQGGIADMAIKQNNYPFLESEVPDFDGKTAQDIMVPAVECVTIANGGALGRGSQRYASYPVLDKAGYLVGSSSGSKINKSPIVFSPNEPLESLYTVFSRLGPHTVYITEDGIFKGLVTRKNVVEAHRAPPVEFTVPEQRFGEAIESIFSRTEGLFDRFRR